MAKNDVVSEALAGMKKVGNPRQPMGLSALRFDNLSADTGLAKQEPRKNAAPDPIGITSGAPARKQGKVGASYRITAQMPAQTTEPYAQLTQANGRLVPPTHSCSGNFYAPAAYDNSGVPNPAPYPPGHWVYPAKRTS